MAHLVTLIPGDGIGPEVAAAARRILAGTGVAIEWEEVRSEPVTERRGHRYIQADWLESVRRNRVALKGPTTTPIAEGHRSLNVTLRQELELYANLGHEYAVFEAVHGSAPDIAGQDKANPTAITLSAVLLLEHLGEVAAARTVRAALKSIYRQGRHRTPDLGGTTSTAEFTAPAVTAGEQMAAGKPVRA